MSEESTDKIKEHMGATWEQSERNQDPVQLWSAFKTTHTAFNTGSKFFDQSTLKKGYHDMKMIQGETLMNLKTRMTTALKAMESIGCVFLMTKNKPRTILTS